MYFPAIRAAAPILIPLFLGLPGIAAGQSSSAGSPMAFSLEQVCEGKNCELLLIANGIIERDSDSKLLNTLGNLPGGITVELNSLGGDLLGGMRLGDAIRTKRLNTRVRYAYPANAKPTKSFLPAECYSACALAFMGGVNRILDERARFGVHSLQGADRGEARPQGARNTGIPGDFNFFGLFGRPPTDKAAADAVPAPDNSRVTEKSNEKTISFLGSYLDQMGVDRKFIDILLTARAGQITTIDLDTARQLTIDNRGRSALANWRLQATTKGDLVSTVTERQRSGNHYITLGLARVDGEPRMLIHLRPSAALTADQLSQIEKALSTVSSIRVEARNIKILMTYVRPWARAKEGFQAWLRLTESELNVLSQEFEFSLVMETPVTSGIDQVTSFGTGGLKNFLAALRKN